MAYPRSRDRGRIHLGFPLVGGVLGVAAGAIQGASTVIVWLFEGPPEGAVAAAGSLTIAVYTLPLHAGMVRMALARLPGGMGDRDPSAEHGSGQRGSGGSG